MSGQRARSNLVNVDGADATDNSVNGVRSTVSQEAVQEFQIISNDYAVETVAPPAESSISLRAQGRTNSTGMSSDICAIAIFRRSIHSARCRIPPTRGCKPARLSAERSRKTRPITFLVRDYPAPRTGFSSIGPARAAPFDTTQVGLPLPCDASLELTKDQVRILDQPNDVPKPIRAQLSPTTPPLPARPQVWP